MVDSPNEAIAHVGQFGSHHSDCIVTRDEATAEQFLREVDSATVYWNASTRFTDGGEFGFGAEIGISTDKLHARGPMGLEELTTYKYVIRGTGQVRKLKHRCAREIWGAHARRVRSPDLRTPVILFRTQRRHRRHPHGATRGQKTGQQRRSPEHDTRTNQRHRIARAHLIQHLGENPAESQREQ